MALLPNAIPSQITTFPVPFDAQLAFAQNQTIVATGFANNLNSGIIDLGGAAPVAAAGRCDGIWSLLLGATNFGTVDESYTFRLLASNDVAFANGNVDMLAIIDVAATAALRNLTNILGATPTMPPTGLAATLIQRPFTNLVGRIYYRFLKCHMVAVGTGPSAVTTSWISRAGIDV